MQIFIGISILLVATLGTYAAWFRFSRRRQPQDEIASEVQAAPKSKASAGSNQPLFAPQSAAANHLYLRGMYFWNKRTVAGFQQAIENFQQATKLDPNYALAYAGLADSYTLLTAYSSSSAT